MSVTFSGNAMAAKSGDLRARASDGTSSFCNLEGKRKPRQWQGYHTERSSPRNSLRWTDRA